MGLSLTWSQTPEDRFSLDEAHIANGLEKNTTQKCKILRDGFTMNEMNFT